MKRQIIRSGWHVVTGKGIGALVGLAINVVLARILSPESFGGYFLFLSVVAIASVLAQLGLGHAIVRLIAESMAANRADRARAAVRLVLAWGAAGSVFALMVIESGAGHWVALNLVHSPVLAGVMWIGGPFVVLTVVQGLLVEILRGYHRIGLATAFGEFGSRSIAAVLFVAIWMSSRPADLSTILLLSLVAVAIGIVFASATVFRYTPYRKGRHVLDRARAPLGSREVFSIALPLFVVNLTAFIPSQFDIWLVGAFRSAADVAQYAAAFRLAILTLVPLTIVSAVMAPTIARYHAQARLGDVETILRGGTTAASVIAIVALVVFLAVGDKVLVVIYGDYYRSAWPVLAILGTAYAINVLAGSCVMVLSMTGHQKQLMYITLTTGILAFVLSLVLVQFLGAVGVALGAASAVLARTLTALYVVERKLHLRTFVQPSLIRHWRQLLGWSLENGMSKVNEP
jgi:O-antigen/teichoic acid export membrane protein